MKRREFLVFSLISGSITLMPNSMLNATNRLLRSIAQNSDKEATTWYIFDQIISQAKAQKLFLRPIGEIMGEIGQLFLGAAYIGGTLEGSEEKCRIDFTGLDCVTLFENVLGLARIIQMGQYTLNDLQKQITYTRYRNGLLDGYCSRLHYTAEWASNNVEKGVITDITKEIGGVYMPNKVSFMSTHPQFYPMLKNNSENVLAIAAIEANINSRERFFIPKKNVAAAENLLQTGDIIAIATSKNGLDYAHTGIIIRDKKGKARLLHASATKKKVVLDSTISAYLRSVSTHTGISVLRPLDSVPR